MTVEGEPVKKQARPAESFIRLPSLFNPMETTETPIKTLKVTKKKNVRCLKTTKSKPGAYIW